MKQYGLLISVHVVHLSYKTTAIELPYMLCNCFSVLHTIWALLTDTMMAWCS